MPYLFVLSPFTVHIVYDLDRFGGNCVNRHAFFAKSTDWKLETTFTFRREGRKGVFLSRTLRGDALTAKNLAHKLNDVFLRE